ncbi:PTS system IIA component, Glc family [Clostridium amylolyticum]|uniref:PTS system IIA component, Glc family n=1 Tax=Clostridium amylolyticum TaxID=1121298 RepID=A0A1M6NEF7_9CLOT|nr:PTS glucose transporter subunit IIA [Clostridium amylolyticum]SHJ94121.1 PTS system IIA component, Glc family [Clostridium amylolyticum]
MFNFFKKNQEILSPVSGKVVDLSQVPDEVFSQKLAGDGVAIEPTSNEIVAPADGVLTLIFNTNHAFALTLKNGVELLIHIGIDTVALNGKGFTRLAEQGTKVKAGTPIVRVDKDFIEKSGYSLVTLALITNTEIVKDINGAIGENAEAGKTAVIDYKMK